MLGHRDLLGDRSVSSKITESPSQINRTESGPGRYGRSLTGRFFHFSYCFSHQLDMSTLRPLMNRSLTSVRASSGSPAADEEVGVLAGLEAAQPVVDPEDLGRIDGQGLDGLVPVESEGHGLGGVIGQVLAGARVVARREADRDPGLGQLDDVAVGRVVAVLRLRRSLVQAVDDDRDAGLP